MSEDGGASSLEPLGYWSGRAPRRDPLVVSVIVVGFCIALISILYSGISGLISIGQARHMGQAITQLQRTPTPRRFAAPTAVPTPTSRPLQFRALTAGEISSAINIIEHAVESPHGAAHLTDAQKATLTKLLSADSQRPIDPEIGVGSEVPGQLQVVRATLSTQGELTLTINHGGRSRIYRTRIDAQGQELAAPYLSDSMVLSPPATFAFPQPTPDAEVLRQWGDEFHAEVCGAIFCVASLLLDLMLIVAGILLLFSSRKGVVLMWMYVVVKLLLVACAVSLSLTSVFGDFTRGINSFGVFPVVVSAVYPAGMLFVLPQGVFRSPTLRRNRVARENLADTQTHPPRSWKVVGVMSLVVSLGSFAVLGYCLFESISEVSEVSRQIAAGAPDAYMNEHQIERDSAAKESMVAAVLFLPAIILVCGAILLLRASRFGVDLHRVYAVLQIIGSMALGWVLFSSLLYTDAPPVAAIVIPVFPALIGCIYPVLIFVVLRRRAGSNHVPLSVA
jgi:hypothetical protein